jgi:hypothetical protein
MDSQDFDTFLLVDGLESINNPIEASEFVSLYQLL